MSRVLDEGQLEIDGLLLGPGTPYHMTGFTAGGKPEAAIFDRRNATGDGRTFGRDTLDGRTIFLGIGIDTPDAVSGARAYSELARVWNAARTRGEDGAFVELRMRPVLELPTRVAYGRPRKFDPVNEDLLAVGRVDIVADFDTIDPLFYADVDQVEPVTIPMVPPQAGGFVAPFTDPISVVTTSSGFGGITVGGTESAPLVARVHGPCTNPVIDVLGLWRAQLITTLLYDQWIDIDARPWVKQVRRSDGAQAAGAFTADSPPLSDMTLPPGDHTVMLRGLDATGTSYLTVSWQGAGTTPYWL